MWNKKTSANPTGLELSLRRMLANTTSSYHRYFRATVVALSYNTLDIAMDATNVLSKGVRDKTSRISWDTEVW